MDPVYWLQEYRRLSLVPLSDEMPAFQMGDGKALSRDYMVSRSSHFLSLAGIAIIDRTGAKVNVKASSWRAGGVESAKLANISDSLIMTMGRWTSIAWTSYSFASLRDLQLSAGSMWKAAQEVRPRRPVWLGRSGVADIFHDN